MPVYVHALSHVGHQRTVNEDAVRTAALGPEDWLLTICDGMGGHEGGQVASSVAADHIVRALRDGPPDGNPTDAIYNALSGANDAVCAAAVERSLPTMGTTAVVARIIGRQCWLGWVGDSRAYHFRGRELLDRSQDHTRVAEMLSRGILTPEQAKQHPDAHILTRALGGGKEVGEGFKPSAWNEPLDLMTGDYLLLCSDGLYDLVQDEEIPDLVAGLDATSASERLVSTANERGGHDNISVVLAVVGVPQIPALCPAPHARARVLADDLVEAGPAPRADEPAERSLPDISRPVTRSPTRAPTPLVSAPFFVASPPVLVAIAGSAFLAGIGVGLLLSESTLPGLRRCWRADPTVVGGAPAAGDAEPAHPEGDGEAATAGAGPTKVVPEAGGGPHPPASPTPALAPDGDAAAQTPNRKRTEARGR